MTPRVVYCREFSPGIRVNDEDCCIWQFSTNGNELAALFELLTPPERERAERYRVELPRRQFVVARARLRQILGMYRGEEPREVQLTVEPNGKPTLASGGLHFNLTHSGEYGLVAVARHRVGIDIEQVREMPNAAGLIERFFAPVEAVQYRALPAELQLASFFRGWTCKEALMKATGTGIRNLEECVVDLDVRRTPTVLRYDEPAQSGAWQLASWHPANGYVATLALESVEPLRVTQRDERPSEWTDRNWGCR